MISKHKFKFICLAVLILTVVVIVPAHFAHAASIWNPIDFTVGAVLTLMSLIMTNVFHIVGFIMSMAAGLLNISIGLTLHIREFVQNTAGVYLVWQSIRDISSLLIIFMLLFTSFRMILGLDQEMGKLIKDIIIAGILINFSFFLVGLTIDASNIVSLSLYNAITPNNTCDPSKTDFITCSVNSVFKNGSNTGLSAVLMQNLQVTSIFSPGWMKGSDSNISGTQLKILSIQTVGIFVMIIATMSFFVAACAFIVRLVVLVFLLAFSSIWFASRVFPQLKDLSDKFQSQLKSQLIFMPVYLFLMYAALRIIITMNIGTVSSSINTSSVESVSTGILSLLFNFAFIIIMINIPLIGGIAVASIKGTWLNKWTDDGVKGFQKWAGKSSVAFAGRNTIGRGATFLGENKYVKDQFLRGNTTVSRLLNKGLTKTAAAGFGAGKDASYKATVDRKAKELEAVAKAADYTDEEKSRIIKNIGNEPRVMVRQDKIDELTNGPIATLENQKKVLSERMKDLARDLEKTSNPDEQKAIAAKIEANKEQAKNVREELEGHQKQADQYKTEISNITKEMTDRRKTEFAKRLSGKAGRQAAKNITKEKKPADQIKDMLDDLLKKESGDNSGKDKK